MRTRRSAIGQILPLTQAAVNVNTVLLWSGKIFHRILSGRNSDYLCQRRRWCLGLCSAWDEYAD